ncbi:MAG: lipopolysaccharide biosynthesis protein, partial [Sarcina sp.]
VINLGASIILVKYFGLAGIFMGTTISTIALPLWTQSKLVYNKVFNKSVKKYFSKYFYYGVLTLGVGFFTTGLCNILVERNEFIHLVFKGLICVIVPNVIYIILFYKTKEFQYILGIIKPIILKIKEKFSSKVKLN